MAVVLIVEDEELTALLLSEALNDAGFEVRMAHSASEAYVRLSDEPRSFCAVVTDVNLGDGDDGFCVGRHARALNPAIQVAYMTGNAANLERFEPDRALMFPKPFDPDEVVEQLSLLAPGV